MTERKSGIIFNITSVGGLKYLFNVAYGVGKSALDRMTQDTALELKEHNVAVVGIRPGAVKTEAMKAMMAKAGGEKAVALFGKGETTDFAGKAIVHLVAGEPDMIKRTGTVLQTKELAHEFKFTEDDGTSPYPLTS